MKTGKRACALTFRFQRVFRVFWLLGRSSSSHSNQIEAYNHMLFRSQPRSQPASVAANQARVQASPPLRAKSNLKRPLPSPSEGRISAHFTQALAEPSPSVAGSLPHLQTKPNQGLSASGLNQGDCKPLVRFLPVLRTCSTSLRLELLFGPVNGPRATFGRHLDRAM
ncbi:hypothetical protein KFK09_026584 [Dendrobium nobile]|uniref:Uncharacterized protein n=1 Tax=Dendrobium nobile TaxID=94219 RepID=A0A8T3A898_DENNO|nr:hypothetical protein KFK09_026584 [Dendrobium nobile]